MKQEKLKKTISMSPELIEDLGGHRLKPPWLNLFFDACSVVVGLALSFLAVFVIAADLCPEGAIAMRFDQRISEVSWSFS